MAAKAFESPGVLRFDVPEQVAVAGFRQDPEKSFTGRVPAILDLRDGQKRLADLKQAREFVGLVTGVADDLDSFHRITKA